MNTTKQLIEKALNEYTDDEGSTIGELLNEVFGKPDVWKNFGDVNYMDYGGVQLRWGGNDAIDFVDYSGEPTDGAWYVTEGTVYIADLISNAEELQEKYREFFNWPLDEIKLSDDGKALASYVGYKEDDEDNDILSLVLGAPSYGGYTTDDRAITFKEVASALSEKFGIKIEPDEVDPDSSLDDEKEEALEAAGFDGTMDSYVNEYLQSRLYSDLDI